MKNFKIQKLALALAFAGSTALVGTVHADDHADHGLVKVKKDADAYNASADKSTVAPNNSEASSDSAASMESDAGSTEATTGISSRDAATYSTDTYAEPSAGSASADAALTSSDSDAPQKVHFEFDSAELSDEAKADLDKLAEQLKGEERPITVAISGYTDTSGPEEYNKDLAERRAKAVQTYFKDKDIEVSNWELEAPAEQQPVASNESREGRQENRRVEINLTSSGREVSAVTD